MSKALDDLSARFKPLAIELLARCTEAGIMVMIIETRRTLAEHEANLAKGVSWTQHSKHLDGDAIDICPYVNYVLQGTNKLDWDASDPVWQKLGPIGERLGLRWGGRWAVRDMGHFEYHAAPPPTTTATTTTTT